MKITGTHKSDFIINIVWWRTFQQEPQRKYRTIFFSDTPYCVNIIKTLQRIQSLSLSILSFPVLININI